MSRFRMRGLVVLACGLFSLTVVASGVAGTSKGGSGGGLNDPRSGAALNRDAAKNPAPAPPPLFPGNAQTRINATAVNNPGADATAQDTQSETSVAALGDNVIVAFNDSGSDIGGASKFTGYSQSTNRGQAFTDKGALPTNAFGDAGDPNLAVHTASSSVYLSTLAFNVINAIPVFKSADGGQTFGAPVNGIPGGVDLDKDWMAVDNFSGAGNGTVYLCATDFGFSPAHIVVTHSTDGGATFGPSGGVVLSNTGQSQGCSVAVAPDHSVYVAYFRGNAPNALFIRRSTDGGITFGVEHQIATLNTTSVNGDLALHGGFRTNSFPSLAIDPANGELIVTYNDDPNVGSTADNGDVLYTKSTDDGTTWSPPARVNDAAARDQFTPTVATTPDGKSIMFGYYDRSQDPGNLLFHRQGRAGTINTTTGAIALRRSFQLGPNTPPVIGQDPVVNSTYMGDYDQIAATNNLFQTTWSDNRDGNTFHAHQPDVRNASISTAVTNSDIGVTVTSSPTSINVGSDTTLTVTVSASGDTANDVFVNLSPAAGLKFKSATGPCKVDSGFVGCSLASISAGSSKSVNVVATGMSAGTRTAKAMATTSSKDTNQANNAGSASVTVNSVPTSTSVFSTGNLAVPINDNSTVDVPLTVPDVGAVMKAQALVRLDHTFDADVDMFLVDPSNNTVELSTDNGGSGDNYGSGTNSCSGTPTTFNDSAATSITAGVAPFAGLFKPEQPLSNLLGDPSAGTWKLRVTDDATADTGTIGCFKLRITHP
jgi:subtilisin-like proprotein convertase family protein